MNVNLLLALLKTSLGGPVNVAILSEETQMPVKVIEQDLLSLARNDLITGIKGQEIELSEENRLNLAVFSLEEGADIEKVCRVLGWDEFEDLVARVLEQNNYRTQKHFRFKGLKRRYEIDVIGLNEPIVLSVECKRWNRSGRAAMVDVVRMQVERTVSLARYLPEPRDRLGVARWREVKFIPLVLILSNTSFKISDGVPIIPIFHLNSFLNEMQAYNDKLIFFQGETNKLGVLSQNKG
jgi:Holliday junction resolvase-like predicted endonuclease